jgi:hypothetical protein
MEDVSHRKLLLGNALWNALSKDSDELDLTIFSQFLLRGVKIGRKWPTLRQEVGEECIYGVEKEETSSDRTVGLDGAEA